MIIPIRCFTCGNILADKYDFFIKESDKLLKESDKQNINLARHDDGLTLEELFNSVQKLLSENGVFWLLLPEYELDCLCRYMKNEWQFF